MLFMAALLMLLLHALTERFGRPVMYRMMKFYRLDTSYFGVSADKQAN
jgi:hypothetical protein